MTTSRSEYMRAWYQANIEEQRQKNRERMRGHYARMRALRRAFRELATKPWQTLPQSLDS